MDEILVHSVNNQKERTQIMKKISMLVIAALVSVASFASAHEGEDHEKKSSTTVAVPQDNGPTTSGRADTRRDPAGHPVQLCSDTGAPYCKICRVEFVRGRWSRY